MPELIDKQKAQTEIALIAKHLAKSDAQKAIIGRILFMIDKMPTIDAQPVRHGRWEKIPGMDNTVFCSECLAAANKELAMRYKGCPFCLERMDGGDDDA